MNRKKDKEKEIYVEIGILRFEERDLPALKVAVESLERQVKKKKSKDKSEGEPLRLNNKNINLFSEELSYLLEQIRKEFIIKPNEKYDQNCFSLIYWQRGLWSIEIIDDWHKWMEAGIKEPKLLYRTPEEACKGFLKFIKENKIKPSELQSNG